MLTWKIFEEILHGERKEVGNLTIRALLKNKVLYLAGLINNKLQNTEEWKELERRRKLQRTALAEFINIAEKVGARYVVVKTFKLFPYVPDDVDILILDKHMVNDIVAELAKRGFKVRSKGTLEITISKVANKTFADLDIHFKMAAGEYEYYPHEVIWQNSKKMEVDDIKLNVASWEDECIITLAHAIMKELEVLASDLLHVMICEKKGYIKRELLKSTGHVKTYEVFSKIRQRVIQNSEVLPYQIPLWITALTYLHNMNYRINAGKLKPVRELMEFPKAKSIRKLIVRLI